MRDTYILVDMSNMYHRSLHGAKGDVDMRLGLALHITLHAIRKAWQDFNGKHVIVCLEGKSWRRDIYKPYKANRDAKKVKMTPKEREEDAMFWEVYNEFVTFIREKTNCTVLQHPNLEADDLIAGFIQSHPDDKHVIISSDSDYVQLIAPNVKQYNGVSEVLTTIDGYFTVKGEPVKDNKTNLPKAAPDPEWLLFEKCIRGDTSDNIFSAYPGVKTKSSKHKIGLLEAYEDRKTKGYAWNNLMLQKFLHHDGTEHRVLDDYLRNVKLIDLTAQPDDIKIKIFETILEQAVPKDVGQVGIRLMKFCQVYNLPRILQQVQFYAEPLNARYQ